MDPVAASLEPTLSTLVSIQSVTLQTNDGVAISSDSTGVAKIWDISTGLYKASFQIPAKFCDWADAQLIDGGLVFVWYPHEPGYIQHTGLTHTHAARRNLAETHISLNVTKIHIWSAGKGELQTVDISQYLVKDLRISGDGSKVFLLSDRHIQAWSIQTGEVVGKVLLEGKPCSSSLVVDGSEVWVHFEGSQMQGWDFGIQGSTPTPLSDAPPKSHHLEFINGTHRENPSPSRVEDTVTGQEVFQFSGRYVRPTSTHWDGQYLVAGYDSGEVLILNFNNIIPQ